MYKPNFFNLFKEHPSASLLLVQLLSMCLSPILESTIAGRAVVLVFGVMVLALAVWVVNRSPLVNWVGWVLGGAAILFDVLYGLVGIEDFLVPAYLLSSALYFYAAIGLIAYMLRDHLLTIDELFAACATFTLLAWAFAFAYGVCQIWYPGSFIAAVNSAEPRNWTELLFLSVTIQSGTGLSDIVPITSPARILTMLQMFSGVMYLVLVVSRLVTLSTSQHRKE